MTQKYRTSFMNDPLCTKQENSSTFGSKIRGLKSRMVSNQERIMIARNALIQCVDLTQYFLFQLLLLLELF